MHDIDPKDTEIHDLRNSLMRSQNELAEFRMDMYRLYESLQQTINGYADKTESKKFREGYPVYICRNCESHYDAHGIGEQCQQPARTEGK